MLQLMATAILAHSATSVNSEDGRTDIPYQRATSAHDDSEWEYEYDHTEIERFHFTIDLTTHAPASSRKRKRTEPVRKRRTRAVLHGEGSEQPTESNATPTVTEGGDDVAAVATPKSPVTNPEDVEDTFEPGQIQILDIASTNPIISYKDKLYSCHWACAVGTDLLLAPKTPPENSTEVQILPDKTGKPLYSASKYDILAATSLRLVAKPVHLRNRKAVAPPPQHSRGLRVEQANFLSRLNDAMSRRLHASQLNPTNSVAHRSLDHLERTPANAQPSQNSVSERATEEAVPHMPLDIPETTTDTTGLMRELQRPGGAEDLHALPVNDELEEAHGGEVEITVTTAAAISPEGAASPATPPILRRDRVIAQKDSAPEAIEVVVEEEQYQPTSVDLTPGVPVSTDGLIAPGLRSDSVLDEKDLDHGQASHILRPSVDEDTIIDTQPGRITLSNEEDISTAEGVATLSSEVQGNAATSELEVAFESEAPQTAAPLTEEASLSNGNNILSVIVPASTTKETTTPPTIAIEDETTNANEEVLVTDITQPPGLTNTIASNATTARRPVAEDTRRSGRARKATAKVIEGQSAQRKPRQSQK